MSIWSQILFSLLKYQTMMFCCCFKSRYCGAKQLFYLINLLFGTVDNMYNIHLQFALLFDLHLLVLSVILINTWTKITQRSVHVIKLQHIALLTQRHRFLWISSHYFSKFYSPAALDTCYNEIASHWTGGSLLFRMSAAIIRRSFLKKLLFVHPQLHLHW